MMCIIHRFRGFFCSSLLCVYFCLCLVWVKILQWWWWNKNVALILFKYIPENLLWYFWLHSYPLLYNALNCFLYRCDEKQNAKNVLILFFNFIYTLWKPINVYFVEIMMWKRKKKNVLGVGWMLGVAGSRHNNLPSIIKILIKSHGTICQRK